MSVGKDQAYCITQPPEDCLCLRMLPRMQNTLLEEDGEWRTVFE